MRTRNLVVGVTVLAFTQGHSQDPKVELTLDSPVMSNYVWRGINIVDGPVWQPSLTAAAGGWTLNVWGNLELGGTNDYGPGFGLGRGKFTEVDTTVSFGSSSNDLDWSAGYVRYDFPNTGFDKTSELFASATHASEWSPTLEVYTDIDAVKGTSAMLGVSKSWAAGSDGEVELSFGLGYGDGPYTAYYLGVSKAGLTDANVGVSYSRSLDARSSLTLYGGFSTLLSSDFVPGSGRRDNLTFGVGVTFGF